jgi:hypothetical protein
MLIPYPTNADGSQKQTAEHVCDGCGDFDPWSPESAPAFYAVSSQGRKEFIHQLPRGIREQCTRLGCLRCKIIGCILTIMGDSSIKSDSDMIKMRISADPGTRGLVIGHHKQDRVEVFTAPGNAHDHFWSQSRTALVEINIGVHSEADTELRLCISKQPSLVLACNWHYALHCKDIFESEVFRIDNLLAK